MMDKVKVGVVGCGVISSTYLKNMTQAEGLEVAACADMLVERAQARAAEFGVPWAGAVEDMLADPSIAIVVNLTIPAAHYAVARAALEAGKSVYNEKPLALTREEGQALTRLAREKGVLLGGAPDTFLGAGLQTCRAVMDAGEIGRPVAATAFMLNHGHESWHPDPAFYYQPGGGPLFDMGPYYLTALISLMGPVRRVAALAQTTFAERTITSKAKRGETIQVNTPTHIAATLDFTAGAVGTLITSFDVWAHTLPRIEIYGTEGSLSVPDPNNVGGEVRMRRMGETEWRDVPLVAGRGDNARGLGVADMADALRTGRTPRAGGDLTFHVLDIMQACLESSDSGRHIELTSTCERPAPLPQTTA